MAEPLTNPHDRFFKEVFSRHETARDFLQHYLPPQVSVLLNFDSLEISKDSFIDPDLQEHFSDLLYKVTLHNNYETFIYVLFEHKSYPEPRIALQLLRYMVRIWEQSLRQNQSLRPILPLVVYHGRSRWTVATHFTALLDIPAELWPYVPEYQYWLCDLTQYSDEEIRGGVILRVALLLLKYTFSDDFEQRLGDILRLLRALSERQTGLEYLETILRYIAGSTDRVSEAELRRVVIEVIEQGGELMPTLVEQWLERGRQEGLAKGLEQGLEQGREEGLERGREAALDVLRRFLAHRFGTPLDQFDEALQELDLAAITRLSEVAFEAKNLVEFEVVLTNLRPREGGEIVDQNN